MKTFFNNTRLILLAFVMMPTILNAQIIEVDSLFWAMAQDPAARSANENFTHSAELNALFVNYGVTKYEQALPFARSSQLLDVYEIGCQCDIDSLIYEIQTKFPNMYSGIKRLDYENISLYDPVDWMWFAHADDWLWHLKKDTG